MVCGELEAGGLEAWAPQPATTTDSALIASIRLAHPFMAPECGIGDWSPSKLTTATRVCKPDCAALSTRIQLLAWPAGLPPTFAASFAARLARSVASRRALIAVVLGCVGVVSLASAPRSAGDLAGREQQLQQGIGSDNGRIQSYQGKLSDLRTRMEALETSLHVQQALLSKIQSQLSAARSRLAMLKTDLIRGRRVLAAQLVAQYESPAPNLVGVMLEARGFTDLLDRVRQLRAVSNQNALAVKRVMNTKRAVAAQTARLTDAQARQRRVASAVLIERDQVANIQFTVLQQERTVARDRASKQADLKQVRHRLAVLQARALAAQQASFSSTPAPSGGAGIPSGGFVPHGGEWGFFPAPGTNYSVGEEPEIAARLDTLGKALHLHLIGISGYRTPQHSVEVGGFSDDPHTRGEASDTPGVEGVPESTLLRFGLTRPFPGPAEADHIQLS